MTTSLVSCLNTSAVNFTNALRIIKILIAVNREYNPIVLIALTLSETAFGIETPGNRNCFDQGGFPGTILTDQESDLWMEFELL